MAATRADDRAHGVGRSPAPLFVPGCRARDARRSTEPEDGQLQGGSGVLRAVRRRHRRVAADRSGRAAGATGAGSEAHRGADGRPRSQGADPRCSCAAAVDLPVPEQEIDVPEISSLSPPPLRRVLPEPQTAEQLVDVPVPDVMLAHGRCDLGVKWCQIATRGGRCYWWMAGTRHVQWRRPEGFTASPGRYINTGHGLRPWPLWTFLWSRSTSSSSPSSISSRCLSFRRRSTPGRIRCSSSCTTKTPQGGGHPVWVSRLCPKQGFSDTPRNR